MTENRTWTADLVAFGDQAPIDLAGVPDLQRETVRSALTEVIDMFALTPDGLEGLDLAIVLHKTTKARGTEPSACYLIRLNSRGRIVAEGPYNPGLARASR